MSSRLAIRQVTKSFDGKPVLRDFSLDVADGEFMALLGPSGCGKSTLLAIVAGFERPDQGNIQLDGGDLLKIPAHRRGIGYVPQDYALFSHMTVSKNLAFGLDRSRLKGGDRQRHLAHLVETLDLGHLLKKRPAALNMSEMQKVALGRALAAAPSLILLDEPMSNLDAALRARLRVELKEIQRRFGQTIIYVTHDQVEAMTMADRIAVMRDGEIAQMGTPLDIYRHPRSRYVARFIGEPSINLLPILVEDHPLGRVASIGGHVAARLPGHVPIGSVELAVRPHDVKVGCAETASGFARPVTDIERLGAEDLLTFDIGATQVHAIVPRNFARPGEILRISLDQARIHLFDRNGAVIDIQTDVLELAA